MIIIKQNLFHLTSYMSQGINVLLLQAKTKLFIFKEIIFIVLGHFPCLLLLGLPVDVNSDNIVCCAVGWAVGCAQEVSKGSFFSAC